MKIQKLKQTYNLPALIHLSGVLTLLSPLIPLFIGSVFWVLAFEEKDEDIQSEACKLIDVQALALASGMLLSLPLAYWASFSEPSLPWLGALAFVAPMLAFTWSLWQALRASRGKSTLDAPQKASLTHAFKSVISRPHTELRQSQSEEGPLG